MQYQIYVDIIGNRKFKQKMRWNISGQWYNTPEETNKAIQERNRRWESKTPDQKKKHIKMLIEGLTSNERKVLQFFKLIR